LCVFYFCIFVSVTMYGGNALHMFYLNGKTIQVIFRNIILMMTTEIAI
jgi:hypothetical protein